MNLRPQIALDIGTADTKAATQSEYHTCPSVAVRDYRADRVVTVGVNTRNTDLQDGQEHVWPMQEGVMKDYPTGRALITHVMNRLLPWWTVLRPTVVLSKSQLIRPSQLQQIRQAVRLSGGGSVFAADTTALAALGAGVDPGDTTARMVIDIGAGTTEVAVIVRGTPVVQSAQAVGGQSLQSAIQDYCENEYETDITTSKAEELLIDIGSATTVDPKQEQLASLNTADSITTNDIANAIDNELESITQLIREVMQESSAALLSDIAEAGVLLTGGVAQLNNLDTRLSRRLSVPTKTVQQPQAAVVRGAQQAHQFVATYEESAARNGFTNRKRV
jgi:rod shape-determining protein MreB